MSSNTRLIHGFHPIMARLRHDPESVKEIYLDNNRQDRRVKDLLRLAEQAAAAALLEILKASHA